MNHLTELAKRYEAYETPKWAVEAILNKEILTRKVFDPCCGRGVLALAAERRGYSVDAIDICSTDWGYGNFPPTDFLEITQDLEGHTVLMNPLFSKAVEFVKHAQKLGAAKIVCFQRFAWFEGSKTKGKKRGQFWTDNPPCRVYICGDRASCWRMDLEPKDIEGRGNTPTAHAWFIWERNQPSGTLLSHIFKEDA